MVDRVEIVRQMKDLLSSLYLHHQVADAMGSADVETSSWDASIAALKQHCTEVNAHWQAQRLTWERVGAKLTAESESARTTLGDCATQQQRAGRAGDHTQMEEHEAWLAERTRNRSHQRDVSMLPKLVVRNLASFLDQRDLTTLVRFLLT